MTHSAENGLPAKLLAKVLSEHRYRDVLGDYEVEPYYKHFGCTCGWEQNIAGMSGWRSWAAAHEAHVADALLASGEIGEPQVEWAVEVTWRDWQKAGAKGPTSQYGPFDTPEWRDNFLDMQRREGDITATRVLTRRAAYTPWVGPEAPEPTSENDAHTETHFDLGTPRQYTARGGWNVVCECGEVIGETGDDDLTERHEAHRARVLPPGTTPSEQEPRQDDDI